MTVEQLVLPSPCQGTVLEVAHQIPLVGHKDVEEFCRSCG